MNLIFDFDGTLVDSFQTVIKIFNQLAIEYRFRLVKESEIDHLKKLTSRELIKYFDISLLKLPSVIRRARQYMNKEMANLKPVENIQEVLHQLEEYQLTLGILTSNSFENVAIWLKQNNMKHLFKFIHSDSTYFKKERTLNRMLKFHNLDRQSTIYIGDETRDIEAARKSQVTSIAVTWGFNDESILLTHKPNFIARKPEDLKSMCITLLKN